MNITPRMKYGIFSSINTCWKNATTAILSASDDWQFQTLVAAELDSCAAASTMVSASSW